MALLDEMQALTDDLAASLSSRVAAEQDRRAAGARDARDRAEALRGQQWAAMEDASRRLTEIASRRAEVGEALAVFHARERATAAADARERAASAGSASR